MQIGSLFPRPPYSFAKTLQAARFHTVLDVIREGEYWRALRAGSETALVRVATMEADADSRLDVFLIQATGPIDNAALLEKVSRMLGVTADIGPFYAVARADPMLWGVVEPLVGLRHVRAENLFEALITTIIEQQIALALAQRGERWLVQKFGNAIEYDQMSFYLFPGAEQFASLTVDDLAPLKITRRRMAVVLEVARLQTSGEIDLDVLGSQPIEQIYERLIALKGIGHWTAAWAIIRALGDYFYVGEADVALQAAVNFYFYGQEKRAAPQRVRETLTQYGEFAGAAAFYTLMRWAFDRYG